MRFGDFVDRVLPTADDPLNHTKNHEKKRLGFSFMEPATYRFTDILETLRLDVLFDDGLQLNTGAFGRI
jgi:hypothetical protein